MEYAMSIKVYLITYSNWKANIQKSSLETNLTKLFMPFICPFMSIESEYLPRLKYSMAWRDDKESVCLRNDLVYNYKNLKKVSLPHQLDRKNVIRN